MRTHRDTKLRWTLACIGIATAFGAANFGESAEATLDRIVRNSGFRAPEGTVLDKHREISSVSDEEEADTAALEPPGVGKREIEMLGTLCTVEASGGCSADCYGLHNPVSSTLSISLECPAGVLHAGLSVWLLVAHKDGDRGPERFAVDWEAYQPAKTGLSGVRFSKTLVLGPLQSGVTRFEFFVEGSEELVTLVAFDCTTFSRVPVVGLTLLGPDPTSTRDAVHLNTDALRCLRSRTIHPSAHVRFSLTCSEIGAFDVRLSIGDELVHEARVVSSTLLLERTVTVSEAAHHSTFPLLSQPVNHSCGRCAAHAPALSVRRHQRTVPKFRWAR